MSFEARLTEAFGEEKARVILDMIRGEREPEDVSTVCAAWVAKCYHEPKRFEKIMRAANQVLEGHGVEGFEIPGRNMEFLSYVNM